MANMSNFTEIVLGGLNNPDCSFYTGAFVGQLTGIKIVFWLGIFYITIRAIDRIVLAPIFNHLGNKLRELLKRRK